MNGADRAGGSGARADLAGADRAVGGSRASDGIRLRIATRASPLARWQAQHVADLLELTGFVCELVVVSTTGDELAGLPISALGASGAFVTQVQAAVLDGRAELAVHSAKDLPSAPTPGLVIGAIPPRADPRDALVGSTLDGLSPGAVVATGSPRRRAQLAFARPDLAFTELRGNIETRLGRVPSGGAIVVAAAALDRLGLAGRAAEVLDPAVMLPQVGQGALAVECRPELCEALAGIDDPPSRRAVEAERAFLFGIGPGCSLPIGAHARPVGAPPGTRAPPGAACLALEGMLGSFDGRVVLRLTAEGTDPVELGCRLATAMASSPVGRSLMAAYRL
ncbi:MAG: hydroxymethylbilane synthase [Acidimicrobiales bacterium]